MEHQTLLAEELNRRRRLNPMYSLRAFAKLLEMSPSHLCLLMNGKKRLTSKQALKIASKIPLSSAKRQRLFQSLLPPEGAAPLEAERRLLREDGVALLSDWRHLAVLSLGDTRGCKFDATWVAGRLGISKYDALESLHLLRRMELIRVEGGSFRQTGLPFTTTDDVPTLAIREHHKGMLRRAEDRLESVPVGLREFSTLTFAVDPEQIETAKKLLREFQDRFASEVESKGSSEVYTLAIQFFPQTQTAQEREGPKC